LLFFIERFPLAPRDRPRPASGYATLGERESFTTSRTPTPHLVSISISESVLNRAEQIDASSQQIADAGLRHPQQLGDFSLLETSGGNQLLQLDEQMCADCQVPCLLAREADVSEDVATRRRHFNAAFLRHGVAANTGQIEPER